jgi:hypothetical protein
MTGVCWAIERTGLSEKKIVERMLKAYFDGHNNGQEKKGYHQEQRRKERNGRLCSGNTTLLICYV